MPNASPVHPMILVGASIPRSGHHYLADMLTGYFGEALYYCEYYTLSSCCRNVPCTRRGRHSIIYQKSHDRDFTLPADVAEALYLVQYRHPVPEALSDRELELRDTLGRPNLNFRRTRAGYLTWLAAKALYYRKFHDKWVAHRLPNAMYLDYNDLAANPKSVLAEIVARAVGAADAARIAQTVDRINAPRTAGESGEKTAFKPRVIADSPYFDAGLLGALESWILERCPHYGFSRELTGSYEGSELHGLILLKDPQEPLPKGETKRFRAAAALAPHHPEIRRRMAVRLMRDGKAAQAVKRVERLIADEPYFGPAWELLFSACEAAGVDVPESVLNGDALIACSESADLSTRLGDAFRKNGYTINAMAAYSFARALEPESREVSERLAEAAAAVRR